MKKPIAVGGTLALAICLYVAYNAYAARQPACPPVKLWIFTYHSISTDPATWSPYVISPEELEADLRYLQDNGYQTILSQDLINYMDHGAPLPDKPVMLTFDDGYRDNYDLAFPLLERYQMRALMSLIGTFADRAGEDDVRGMMSWSEARALAESGLVELANHSYDLHKDTPERYGALKNRLEPVHAYRKMLSEDLRRTQEAVFARTGFTPTAFTYPYGAVSNASVSVLRELGFAVTLTTETGCNDITSNPSCLYGLRRNNRAHGVSVEALMQSWVSPLHS